MRRPCINCGNPTNQRTRCDTCTSAANRTRGSATARGYNHAWQQASTQAIRDWVNTNGWTCPGWRRPTHDVQPGQLTGDHAIALANGGPRLPDHIAILCRPCNSAKRDRT